MKRFHITVKNKTYARIETLVAKCNEGFEDGIVRVQDVIDWMLATGSADVQKIRQRCMNLPKILKNSPTDSLEDLKELKKKISIVESMMSEEEGEE